MRVSGFEPELISWKPIVLPLTPHPLTPSRGFEPLSPKTRISNPLHYRSANSATPSARVERTYPKKGGFKPPGPPLPNDGINVILLTNDKQAYQPRPLRELNPRLLRDREVFCHYTKRAEDELVFGTFKVAITLTMTVSSIFVYGPAVS